MPAYVARNAAEAILMAEEFQAAGQYDLFRGQLSADWDCVPSLFRVPTPKQAMAEKAARRYLSWVNATPGLEEIRADPDLVLAVAQHHGLPTRLLDFTTSPRIAGFFATDGDQSAHAEGAIILLHSTEVAEYAEILPDRVIRVLRPRLDNLWRLTAQCGVFVETEFPSLEYLAMPSRITFPHDQTICGPTRSEVFPPRSPLEILLRQYFDNEIAIDTWRYIETVVKPQGVAYFVLPTWEQNREYFRAGGLDRLDSWRSEHIEPWLRIAPEPLSTPEARKLSIPWEVPASEFGDSVRDQICAHMADSQLRTMRIRWHCNIDGPSVGDHDIAGLAEQLCVRLGILWDGLRRLCYDDAVLASGMGLCAAILRGKHDGRTEKAVLEELLGPITKIGFGAADGSGAVAYAASTDLRKALRRDLDEHAAPSHRETFGELSKLLQLETRPEYLFEFEELADLFGRQIAAIQTTRYGTDRVIFFSPARLQSFGAA